MSQPQTKFLGNPYLQDPDLTIWNGDVREVLRSLPDESVQMCVTSPPYWGLRDYGTGAWEGGDTECDHSVGGQVQQTKAGTDPNAPGMRPGVNASRCRKCGATRVDNQIGLEPTPEAFVATMVEVFREVRRVLRKDGTLWLNLGDSYSGIKTGGRNDLDRIGTPHADALSSLNPVTAAGSKYASVSRERLAIDCGLKPKDLCMIPARVALALQADGWYLRSEITWCKPNPMPESVTDRPTQATEKVYLFSKSARYFYDAEAVREPHVDFARGANGRRIGSVDERAEVGVRSGTMNNIDRGGAKREYNPSGRNLRNWWEIATEPYPEAHFATYPTELVRRCILAGTSERGCCLECGAPWVRELETTFIEDPRPNPPAPYQGGNPEWSESNWKARGSNESKTIGWRPSCECGKDLRDLELLIRRQDSCIILDPFFGSGTTGLVARKHGRKCIGIELSPEYCALAAKRLSQLSLLAEGAA